MRTQKLYLRLNPEKLAYWCRHEGVSLAALGRALSIGETHMRKMVSSTIAERANMRLSIAMKRHALIGALRALIQATPHGLTPDDVAPACDYPLPLCLDKLRARIGALKIEKKQLAHQCGVSYAALHAWGAGKKPPRPRNIEALSLVLGDIQKDSFDD